MAQGNGEVAITKGTIITREMLAAKRPGMGISPIHMSEIVGRCAAVDIMEDEVIAWDMLEPFPEASNDT